MGGYVPSYFFVLRAQSPGFRVLLQPGTENCSTEPRRTAVSSVLRAQSHVHSRQSKPELELQYGSRTMPRPQFSTSVSNSLCMLLLSRYFKRQLWIVVEKI